MQSSPRVYIYLFIWGTACYERDRVSGEVLGGEGRRGVRTKGVWIEGRSRRDLSTVEIGGNRVQE